MSSTRIVIVRLCRMLEIMIEGTAPDPPNQTRRDLDLMPMPTTTTITTITTTTTTGTIITEEE